MFVIEFVRTSNAKVSGAFGRPLGGNIMERCRCGSYAVNIERNQGRTDPSCDVCHWRIRAEAALRLLDGKTPQELVAISGLTKNECKELWRKMKGI